MIIKKLIEKLKRMPQDAKVVKISDYLKVTDAAKFLGITPITLIQWEKEKKLPVYRDSQNLYRLYKKEDLEELLGNIKSR